MRHLERVIRHEDVILLVEDDDDQVELARRAVAEASPRSKVRVASSADAALDYLRGRGVFEGRDPHRVPALVLSKLSLAASNGLELLGSIRAEETTRHVPVVMLATDEDDRAIHASYELGANSCVRRPIDEGELVETIRELAHYWLLVNEKPHPDE